MNDSIKFCESCGSRPLGMVETSYFHGEPDKSSFWIECECGTKTHTYYSSDKAIEKWNLGFLKVLAGRWF